MPPDYVLSITTKPAAADAEPVTIERFVRAKNQATALSHVVNDTITVKLAQTEDIQRLTKASVELETAGE